MRVSEIRVKQIRVNQGLGVYFFCISDKKKLNLIFAIFLNVYNVIITLKRFKEKI